MAVRDNRYPPLSIGGQVLVVRCMRDAILPHVTIKFAHKVDVALLLRDKLITASEAMLATAFQANTEDYPDD